MGHWGHGLEGPSATLLPWSLSACSLPCHEQHSSARPVCHAVLPSWLWSETYKNCVLKINILSFNLWMLNIASQRQVYIWTGTSQNYQLFLKNTCSTLSQGSETRINICPYICTRIAKVNNDKDWLRETYTLLYNIWATRPTWKYQYYYYGLEQECPSEAFICLEVGLLKMIEFGVQ